MGAGSVGVHQDSKTYNTQKRKAARGLAASINLRRSRNERVGSGGALVSNMSCRVSVHISVLDRRSLPRRVLTRPWMMMMGVEADEAVRTIVLGCHNRVETAHNECESCIYVCIVHVKRSTTTAVHVRPEQKSYETALPPKSLSRTRWSRCDLRSPQRRRAAHRGSHSSTRRLLAVPPPSVRSC